VDERESELIEAAARLGLTPEEGIAVARSIASQAVLKILRQTQGQLKEVATSVQRIDEETSLLACEVARLREQMDKLLEERELSHEPH